MLIKFNSHAIHLLLQVIH